MSAQNVELFIRAIDENPELSKGIAAVDATVGAWQKVAGEGGYDFTESELKAGIGRLLGHEPATDNAVREYLIARAASAGSELSEGNLDQVSGGKPTISEIQVPFIRDVASP